MSLGLTLSNPMNIRASGEVWNGEHRPSRNPAFKEFVDFAHGIRAGAKLLMNYQLLHGDRTLTDLIIRFAPPHENDTAKYIEHVSAWAQVPALDRINLIGNEPLLLRIVTAMCRQETGYTDSATIAAGVHLAVQSVKA